MRRPIQFLAAAVALSVLAGCPAQTHIGPYVPKKRVYESPTVAPDESTASAGSLWQDRGAASMLFTDARALRENDLVIVKIEEIADAKRNADTEVNRSSNASFKISEFLGLLSQIQTVAPWFKPELGVESGSGFHGQGSTARTDRLTATVPSIVRKVMPNGNLFIEGHRVVLLNQEEHHFYISGVVRPIDIDQENSVKSSAIADAEIEFTGRGVLADNQERGWLQKYLGWLWPF